MPLDELRVFYPANPPSVMLDCNSFPHLYANKYCPYPGLMVEIIGLLARESNLTIKPLIATDFGHKPDQLKDVASAGLLEMLQNGTVDLIAMSFQVTEQRERHFSFTEPLYEIETRILKRPQTKKFTKIWAFFENYDTYTWSAFAFVWLAQWLLGLLVLRVEAKARGRRAPKLLESTWKFLRMLLRQPTNLHCCSWGGKVAVFLFAFVQCTVLLGLYSSLILANIIRSNNEGAETVGTVLEQLTRKEQYMVTDAPTKWLFQFINNSLAYPYPEFKRALRHNPFKVTQNVDDTLGEILLKNAVVFVQDDDKVNYQARVRCDLLAVKEGMPLAKVHLMLARESPMVEQLNTAIERNQAHLRRLSRKYMERMKMERVCEEGRGFRALTIGPYAGVCFICLFVILLAFVAFLVEKVAHRLRTNRFY